MDMNFYGGIWNETSNVSVTRARSTSSANVASYSEAHFRPKTHSKGAIDKSNDRLRYKFDETNIDGKRASDQGCWLRSESVNRPWDRLFLMRNKT